MNLRCYTFNNYYLSSIQQGIQAAHSQTSLMRKIWVEGAVDGSKDASVVDTLTWACSPVTIVLNGGNNQDMLDFERSLVDCNRPWSSFREDEQSLGRLLTSISILLPESIYEEGVSLFKTVDTGSVFYDKEDKIYVYTVNHVCRRYTEVELSIIKKIASCGLAR